MSNSREFVRRTVDVIFEAREHDERWETLVELLREFLTEGEWAALDFQGRQKRFRLAELAAANAARPNENVISFSDRRRQRDP